MAAPLSSQISSAITLGGNSSITKHVIERLYAGSGELDDKGLYSSRDAPHAMPP